MTYDDYFNKMDKRLANGLSILDIGTPSMNQSLTFALEAHRLLPYASLCSLRYVFRMIYLKLKSGQPDKAQLHHLCEFYPQLAAVIGDRKWPDPKIKNNTHDAIRMKMQEVNALIEKSLNGEKLTENERRICNMAASDYTKKKIKENEAIRKEAAKAAAKAKRQAELDAKSADRKLKASKIKNGGHKEASSTEARSLSAAELDRKVREIYTQRHGSAPEHIPMEEYREITALIHGESVIAKRENERRMAYSRLEERKSLPYCVSHKTRLMLNNRQRNYIDQCIGIARFCYNWCFDEWTRLREQGEKPFANPITAKLNEIAKEKYPFTYKVTHFAKKTGTEAFENAVNGFFSGKGFPRRKQRGLGLGSLKYTTTSNRKLPYLSDVNLDIPDSHPSKRRQYLLIPTFGYVKMAEKLRFNGQLTSVTIRRDADGHYYASLNVYISQEEWIRTHRGHDFTYNRPTGIDLGLKTLATLSNGVKIESMPDDEKLKERKKQLQKVTSNKRKLSPHYTSKNMRKAQWRLAKVNAKMRRQREDYVNKVTTAIAYFYKNLCIENLSIRDMISDGMASPGRIIEANFYRFRTLLEDKCKLAGHHLHVAEKFLPSTRCCSVCGCVGDKVPLEVRTFHCKECGATIDRDVNAAINLARLIGLDDPNPSAADKGAITAVLQANRIMVNQAEGESR